MQTAAKVAMTAAATGTDAMWTLIIVALAALSWLLQVSLGGEAGLPDWLPAQALRQLATGLTVLAGVQLLHRLLSHGLRHAGGSASSDLLQALLRVLLYLVASLLYLRLGLGLDITSVLATSALFSVIVGLALQPTLGHLFAGISLEIERPLRVGDCIRREQLEGEVVSLSWRSVSVRTPRGSIIVLPNADFTSRALEVVPRGQPFRHELGFSISSRHPPGQIIRCALRVLHSGLPGICHTPAPSVLLADNDARSASLRFTARFFTQDFLNRHAQGSQFLERLWYALAREGVALPEPPALWNQALDEAELPTGDEPPFTGSLGIAARGPAPLHPEPAVLARGLAPLPAPAGPALLRHARALRYARAEPCDTPGLALVLHGSLREQQSPAQAEAALQRLLLMLGQPPQAGEPRRRLLSHPHGQALLQAGRLALGPLAEQLVGRIAALTDDAWLAAQALAALAGQPELLEQLRTDLPAVSTRLCGPGDWTVLRTADPVAGCVAEQDCGLLLWDAAALARVRAELTPQADAALVTGLRQVLPAGSLADGAHTQDLFAMA
ncbi:MAG: hypothetical protein DI603_18750 [Roseateles depolymerans]|uniref:Mechanosensitive ion channel MscS domain-containing protein n=1 Tax=Roseateles depolymerans TaxID=76731 RepID=A0A2W5FGG0_9BURK|nr:MAG: hypothetical protein DI603_18750 [Roseateles depolymerans]